MTTVSRPFASRTVTGAISASNRPASMAAIAFWWLASANASWSSRLTCVLDRDALGVGAHVAVLDRAPQAVVDGRVDRARRCRGGSRSGRPAARYGAPFIDSMPPATATSASPARISAAASMIALSPEPQTRLMVVAEVVSGRPALSTAWRAGAWPTPAWRTWPIRTSSIGGRGRIEAGPLDGGPDGDAAELRRPGRALSAPPNLPIGVRAALTR